MFDRIGHRWMEKHIAGLQMYDGGIKEIRKQPSREIFRAIALDIAYRDSMQMAQ